MVSELRRRGQVGGAHAARWSSWISPPRTLRRRILAAVGSAISAMEGYSRGRPYSTKCAESRRAYVKGGDSVQEKQAGQLAVLVTDFRVRKRSVAGAARMCDLGGASASVVEGQAHLGCESLVGREVVAGPLVVSQCSVDQRPDVVAVDPVLREFRAPAGLVTDCAPGVRRSASRRTPCMRFPRTRLSDVLHRRRSAGARQGWKGLGAMTGPHTVISPRLSAPDAVLRGTGPAPRPSFSRTARRRTSPVIFTASCTTWRVTRSNYAVTASRLTSKTRQYAELAGLEPLVRVWSAGDFAPRLKPDRVPARSATG